MIVGFLAFMVFMAVILAFWEIQIEGKYGWAAKLPTWRIRKKWVMRIMGGRPLTGYHTFMVFFLILIIHLPLFFVDWSWRLEFLLFGFLLALLVVEDFSWFIFNPHYGFEKFRKKEIPWHKHWWGPVPDFYWWFASIATILIYFGSTAI